MRPVLRSLRRDEVSALTDLVADAVPHLRFAPEDLEQNLFEPGSPEHASQLVLVRGTRIVGVACGTVRPLHDSGAPPPKPEGLEGYVKLLAVSARERRQGHGSRLLAALEETLWRRKVQRIFLDGAAPVYLQPGLPESCRPALAFFARHGYGEAGRRRSLVAVLDGVDLDTRRDEERLLERGFEVRRARPDDRASLVSTVGRSFSLDWATEVRHALDASRAVLHVGLRDGDLAGFAVAGLWGRNAFGPMGTLEACRGGGLGTTLLRRSLGDLERAGERSIVISWIGPESFYRRSLASATVVTYAVLVKELLSGAPCGK